MRIRIDVYHHLGSGAIFNQILKGQENLMSKITDFAAKEQTDITALNTKLDAIAAGVAELKTLISTLENTVTGLTAEEQAALDAVVSSSDALVTKANAIDTGAPAVGPSV